MGAQSALAVPLENGGVVAGAIETAGNQDEYEFEALTGDTISLTMVDLGGTDPNQSGDIYPRFYLYDPNGALITSGQGPVSAAIVNRELPLNGTYTVLAQDYYNTGTGPYEIHFALAKGAQEHGELIDGGKVTESLSIGDLDSYTFEATTGDRVALTMVDLEGGDPNLPGDIYPRFYLYDPNGQLLASAQGPTTAAIVNTTIPLNGTYTVVAMDYYATGTGPYEMHFARAPGAQEHGGLVDGGNVSQTLTLGDLDTYTFYGETGDRIALTMVDLEGGDPNLPGDIYPRFFLYDLNGALVASAQGPVTANLFNTLLPLNGTYTVVALDYYATGTGPYEMHFARAPGAREHGALVSGEAVEQSITSGDIDSYTFYGSSGDTVSLTMTDLEGADPNLPGDIYPRIFLYDPDGVLVTSAAGPLTATIANRVLTISGSYTVVAADYYATGTGPYNIEFSSTNQSLPAQVTLLGPSGGGAALQPAIGWTPSGHARYYLVYMRDLSGSRFYRRIFRAESLGCAGGRGLCSIALPVTVDRTLRWWVRPLNEFGFGQWSAPKVFSATSGLPSRASTVAPAGNVSQSTPVYQWSRIANASRYRLLVRDETGERVRKDISAGQAGCVAAGQTCTYRFDTSVRGSVSWYVRSYNSQGYGAWSQRGVFNVF